jgi:hypothetical protein
MCASTWSHLIAVRKCCATASVLSSPAAGIHELRNESLRQLAHVIDRSLAGTDPGAWESAAQSRLSAAIEEIFEAAREQMTRVCSTNANQVLSAYQTRSDDLIVAIRRAAAELFDILFRDDIDRDSFALGEDPLLGHGGYCGDANSRSQQAPRPYASNNIKARTFTGALDLQHRTVDRPQRRESTLGALPWLRRNFPKCDRPHRGTVGRRRQRYAERDRAGSRRSAR